ncbi:Crp/Fnr family transcriptional regulator [Paenibacillus sp. JX-17]|uniref:Crp/Fnr family transcriptional regulator n=1 Tax=Paenibacillus lacisoli TaxID=3064525 RepID=A0ABT9CGL9_9BACL|nr:Crp/Fnr family transcriptional regulator [Paenibacillus sp. JX-17]MDO7906836.1 Crp/Fnr family transcriptional regulator [Paenibacillus sp. JX-17]
MGMTMMERTDVMVAAVGRGGIEKYLTAGQADLLGQIMQPKKAKAGMTLFMEGEQAGQLYYIRSGRVQLRKSTEDGKELILSIQQNGDIIGEFSGLGGEEYTYTAEIVEAGELGVIRVKDLEQLLVQHGDLAVQFMKWMGTNQRIQQSRFRDLLLYGKTGALASTLIRASNSCGVKVPGGIMINMKLNHTVLAEMVGATRESVNRMLSSLKEQGTMDVLDGKLVIRDMEELRSMCGCPTYGRCPQEICRL